MLSSKGLTLVSAMCLCSAVAACGCSPVAAASEYFPHTLSCGVSPVYVVPSPDVLGQAAPAPPAPSFAESFQALCTSAIAPRWLPDQFDHLLYLEHGDGAYRAQTAHLCKVFERGGYTVILRSFAGRVGAIVQPVPVEIPPEAYEALVDAAGRADPCQGSYPYENDSTPAAVVSMFASLRDELLSPSAQPVTAHHWTERVQAIRTVREGIEVSYSPNGPINDPGVDPAVSATPANYGVTIWTDGDVAMVRVGLSTPMVTRSGLYKRMQPIVDVPTEDLRLPYVCRVAAAGEWTDSDENLRARQEEASHQKLYFDLGNGLRWMGLVQSPASAAEIEEAAWLCLARSTVSEVASARYPYWVSQQGETSPSSVLQRLRSTESRHMVALNRLEQAPCPQALAAARSSLLSALRTSKAIWDAALPQWESALICPGPGAVDYETLRTATNLEIASRGLPAPPVGWDWEECWETIRDAESVLGIRTDDVYEP